MSLFDVAKPCFSLPVISIFMNSFNSVMTKMKYFIDFVHSSVGN